MRSIAKIGGIVIALAMLCLVMLNPSSCGEKSRDKRATRPKKTCSIRVASGSVRSGEEILYKIKDTGDKLVVDSMVTLDGIPVYESAITTEELTLGRHDLKVRYSYEDSTFCESSWSVELYSDVTPDMMTYNVLAMYDHDPTAYTQGLLWHEGRIYESTGQYGESRIYNYDVKKSDFQDRIDLPMNVFGEGITILGDKLYQVTYKTRKGFAYDLATMEQLQEFDLPTNEGWGLTDNGRELILSDGSNQLYFLDAKTFEVLRTIPVYDDKQRIESLNELEYVDGFIYANLYGATVIAKIDALSGKVLEYIDCRGILPPELQRPEQDVFNGIAYDQSRGTFYLTGKYWPKLFEVSFVPRAS